MSLMRQCDVCGKPQGTGKSQKWGSLVVGQTAPSTGVWPGNQASFVQNIPYGYANFAPYGKDVCPECVAKLFSPNAVPDDFK